MPPKRASIGILLLTRGKLDSFAVRHSAVTADLMTQVFFLMIFFFSFAYSFGVTMPCCLASSRSVSCLPTLASFWLWTFELLKQLERLREIATRMTLEIMDREFISGNALAWSRQVFAESGERGQQFLVDAAEPAIAENGDDITGAGIFLHLGDD